MLLAVLLFLTILGLPTIMCYGFDYNKRDSDGTIEGNFKNNPRFPYNSPINYDRERDSRDDGRVFFRDNDESNTYTSQKPRNLQACLLSCEIIGDDDPVCGTNGFTYMNIDQLHCAAKCGVDVSFRHYSPCSGWSEVISSTETNDKGSCITTCPTTPEYNPVCGTDDVTYKNHGKLMCAQSCGIDVQLKRHYPCPKKRVTSTESSVSTNTPETSELSRKVKDCIHLCPATSEYSPVCGSDGRTYYNTGKLECARHCGVEVTAYRRSRCTK